MHLYLSFWCAISTFVRAQQELPESTSTSPSSAIPWTTYTSTRSCTSRPSTVFIYTSNSSTFLLPQPGPDSVITPLDASTPSPDSDPPLSRSSGVSYGEPSTSLEGAAQLSSRAVESVDSASFTEVSISADQSTGAAATPTNQIPSIEQSGSTTGDAGSSSMTGLAWSVGSGLRLGTQSSSSSPATGTLDTSAPQNTGDASASTATGFT
jgi:hypothetical protein